MLAPAADGETECVFAKSSPTEHRKRASLGVSGTDTSNGLTVGETATSLSAPKAFPTICAFTGGLRLAAANADAWVELSKAWPGEVQGVDTMAQVNCLALTSLEQLALLHGLPQILRQRCTHEGALDLLLGAWSLGARPAAHVAACLEVFGFTVPGMFSLDDRRKLPFRPCPDETVGAHPSMMLSVETVRLLCDAEPAPRFRLSTRSLEFVCPLSP